MPVYVIRATSRENKAQGSTAGFPCLRALQAPCLEPVEFNRRVFSLMVFCRARVCFCLQNTLLQETVRRECEERYELTAALTQAREQVLQLRKLSGNFPLSPRSLAQGSLTSSAALCADYRHSSRPGPGRAIHPSGQVGIPRAVQAPTGRPSSMTLPALRGRETSARRRQRSQLWHVGKLCNVSATKLSALGIRCCPMNFMHFYSWELSYILIYFWCNNVYSSVAYQCN